MKILRVLFFVVLSGIGFAPAAFGADALNQSEQRMIGIWQEYEPGENVVEYFADHTMKIYLTEEEGGSQAMHWIEAHWQIDQDNMLTLTIMVNGKPHSEKVKLSFENDEMWLEDEDDVVTKQRRISAVPAKFKW